MFIIKSADVVGYFHKDVNMCTCKLRFFCVSLLSLLTDLPVSIKNTFFHDHLLSAGSKMIFFNLGSKYWLYFMDFNSW